MSHEAPPSRAQRRAAAKSMALALVVRFDIPFRVAWRAISTGIAAHCTALAASAENPSQAFTAAVNVLGARRDSVPLAPESGT